MRRRWFVLVALAVCLPLMAGIVATLSVPADPISPEGAARITEGMTEEEVEEALGGQKPSRFSGGTYSCRFFWVGESGCLAVRFTNWPYDSRVSGPAEFIPAERRPLLDRLRTRLDW